MGYKSKFKGAEIDAHLEKMVNVTYAELKALRDEGKLIAGQMYRMTDYETACTWENTQVAGHPFDLVLTALDNKTLDEKCSAIWSERDKDGYFANSNLAAWDVRYCLDNDFIRFDWAVKGGKYLIVDDGNTYTGVLDGTIVIDGQTYYKWTCTDGLTILCTLSKNPSANEEVIIVEIGYEEDYWYSVVVRTEDREDGKGVVYRLIDESRNDVPYDFKNIMFSRQLTEGKYDTENGVDTFCYTFCSIDFDTFEIADQSVIEKKYCYGNAMGDRCYDNVFLNFKRCYCNSNTFGKECINITFGNECLGNTFGDYCRDNTIGDYCSATTFGDYCRDNTIGNSCGCITFGNECFGNAIGDSCSANTFGDRCNNTTIGNSCGCITFGKECITITIGDSCDCITFGNRCNNTTIGDSCDCITFGNECFGNAIGDSCSANTFGDKCYSITIGNFCRANTFGDKCTINFFNSETASNDNAIQNYHISRITYGGVQVYRNRNYDTYITTDKNGNIVEYTVDDIINK